MNLNNPFIFSFERCNPCSLKQALIQTLCSGVILIILGGCSGEPIEYSSMPGVSSVGEAGRSNDPKDDSELDIGHGNLVKGMGLFIEHCVGCHNIDGKGGFGGALEQCIDCSGFEKLVERITKTMPTADVTNCMGECAEDIASFMLNGFVDQVANEPSVKPTDVPTSMNTPKPVQTSLALPTPVSISTPISIESPTPLPTGVQPPLDNLLSGKNDYESMCVSCHGIEGKGGFGGSLIGCETCSSLSSLADKIEVTMPIPDIENCDKDCAQNIASYMLNDFKTEIDRTDNSIVKAYHEKLKKFAVSVIGRMPTSKEYDQSVTEEGFEFVVRSMMSENTFSKWVMNIFNDIFVTDEVVYSHRYSKRYYEFAYDTEPELYSDSDTVSALDFSDIKCRVNKVMPYSLRTEPLQLVRYIAENDRHIDEILTADYMMVNAYSQYEVFWGKHRFNPDVRIEFSKQVLDPEDPDGSMQDYPCAAYLDRDWKDASVDERSYYDIDHFEPITIPRSIYKYVDSKDPDTQGYHYDYTPLPLSGVLTSQIFRNSLPTNNINKNRSRAAFLLEHFLGVNVRDINHDTVSQGYEFPVIEDPNCTECHNVLDPVASSFRNWGNGREYLRFDTHIFDSQMGPNQGILIGEDAHPWEQAGMLSPGFEGISFIGVNNSIQELAKAIVAQERQYRASIIRILHKGLGGRNHENPDYYRSIYDEFLHNDVDTSKIKDLIIALIKSENYHTSSDRN